MSRTFPPDTSGPSPCSVFCYQYGAEAYYSGVRVVVIAKKIGYDDNFAKAEIQARLSPAERHANIEPAEETHALIDDHTLSDLPLYTLILELVDLSDAEWSAAEIRFPATAETSGLGPGPLQQILDTYRVLYEYAKRTTLYSPSCVLPLITLYLQRRRKPKNHGSTKEFSRLPPSEVFTQPPPEILYYNFSDLACKYYVYSENWLKDLLAASLVCRAWWKVALSIIYEDFNFASPPQNTIHIGRLVTTLKDNPQWGSALTIFKTASNMRRLSVGDVSAVLADGFVEAFCKMSELRGFVQFSMRMSRAPIGDDSDSAEETYLNAAQLMKCFAHWPKLRWAAVCQLGEPFAEDNGLMPTLAHCALNQIEFGRGLVPLHACKGSSLYGTT